MKRQISEREIRFGSNNENRQEKCSHLPKKENYKLYAGNLWQFSDLVIFLRKIWEIFQNITKNAKYVYVA